MNNRLPDEVTRKVVETLAITQQRGLLQLGWGGLQRYALPETVMMIDGVPHNWLIERTTAVVHHGGAGTIAASLRAGVPTVTISFLGDQTFWGERIYRLGLGPKPIPRKQLTTESLVEAIHIAVLNQDVRRRAAQMGEYIRAEDGVAQAVAAFQKHIPSS
jgi:UDP:flavonoid glycosyltransferase YjiC (YdhE family)